MSYLMDLNGKEQIMMYDIEIMEKQFWSASTIFKHL